MQLNLKEVASNMRQLDEESAQLFERLGNLRTELQQETVEFEEKKQARTYIHTSTYTYIHTYYIQTYIQYIYSYIHTLYICIHNFIYVYALCIHVCMHTSYIHAYIKNHTYIHFM